MDERESLNIRPERIGGIHVEERSNTFRIIASMIAIAGAVGYAGYYFYTTAEMFNPYKEDL